ncbi:hypothetical protein D3C72_1662060 [compost metagenome]
MACRISCLTRSSCAGCIENSRRPMPSSNRVINGSPAISPHTATGTPARLASRMVRATSCSTAGCSGSNRCATALSARSIASVYWIRSLVPMDRKSILRRNSGNSSTAAGISIMAPTFMPGSYGSPRSSSWRLALAISARVWSISLACASIGTSSRTGPKAEARSSARSCVRNMVGSDNDQRIARRPSAGFSAVSNSSPRPSPRPSRPSSGLSAPTSMVRMVTGRPCMASTAPR